MWVEDKTSLRVNFNEAKNENENEINDMMTADSSDFSALTRLVEDFNSTLKLALLLSRRNRFLNYLTMTTRKIKLSSFNKR